jgi:fructose-1,6-bisphosphatase/inositol monophosphatase family enzyme
MSDLRVALGAHVQFQLAGMEAFFGGIWQQAALSRTCPDVFGHAVVYGGGMDVMVDPALKAWDAAAARLLILEAGGAIAMRPSHAPDCQDVVLGTPAAVNAVLKAIDEVVKEPSGSGPAPSQRHPWHIEASG